ncbi:MAG: TRAP transporter small permease subunit [Exilibacterium sp.]
MASPASPLSKLVNAIDAFSEITGRAIAWLTLAMMIITCIVVALRYGFRFGSLALQESVTYLHACVFLLGIAFAFKHDAHVRVDIFYRRFSPRRKAWVNSLGSLVFLLPFCVFLLGVSWNFVANSWAVGEVSVNPGGIPAVFVLKTLLPVAAVTLALQGLADVLRNLLLLISDP